MSLDRIQTDILILGAGGAGLMAALHAYAGAPDARIMIAAKGLIGQSGGTRTAQDGIAAAILPSDSVEHHFMDTVSSGSWLSNQQLAWKLCQTAGERVRELENEVGCFFDRTADGALRGKAVSDLTFPRLLRKGDITGIEVVSRLTEQVMALPIERLDEHRAIALIRDRGATALAGVLMIDVRSGGFMLVETRAVLLATGGGPAMYRHQSVPADKSLDGLAMALRAGLPLRDMEMVQFHPTGILAGPRSRMTGTLLEDGPLRAGGFLLNGQGERFMESYDPRAEYATGDVVARGIMAEIRAGRGTQTGGVTLSLRHHPADAVRRRFAGMAERCADFGFDLAGDGVDVIPTAHSLLGGVVCSVDTVTELSGLHVAGEDAGGVHGASRLDGNGMASSAVYGAIAGDVMAASLGRAEGAGWRQPDMAAVETEIGRAMLPFTRPTGDLNGLRERLGDLMWADAGVIRDNAGLNRALAGIDRIDTELQGMGTGSVERAFNSAWHDWLNLRSLIEISRVIVRSALARDDSLGVHFRADYPASAAAEATRYTVAKMARDGDLRITDRPVDFSIVAPGQLLLPPGAKTSV